MKKEDKENEEVENIMALLSAGNWFKFWTPFTNILSVQESAVLCYLIDVSQGLDLREKNGWFYMKIERLENRLGIGRFAQQTVLTSLERQGLIERKREGVPPKRYIKISGKDLKKLVSRCRKIEKSKALESHHS